MALAKSSQKKIIISVTILRFKWKRWPFQHLRDKKSFVDYDFISIVDNWVKASLFHWQYFHPCFQKIWKQLAPLFRIGVWNISINLLLYCFCCCSFQLVWMLAINLASCQYFIFMALLCAPCKGSFIYFPSFFLFWIFFSILIQHCPFWEFVFLQFLAYIIYLFFFG